MRVFNFCKKRCDFGSTIYKFRLNGTNNILPFDNEGISIYCATPRDTVAEVWPLESKTQIRPKLHVLSAYQR